MSQANRIARFLPTDFESSEDDLRYSCRRSKTLAEGYSIVADAWRNAERTWSSVSLRTSNAENLASVLRDKFDLVALEGENRRLYAALEANKIEIMNALAASLLAAKEQFGGCMQIDVINDPEYPSDWHVVLAVADDCGKSHASMRMDWRDSLRQICGGMFDGIRLVFEHHK